MNKPVAWMQTFTQVKNGVELVKHAVNIEQVGINDIPLYTHPAKELHLSLQKEKETGELLAVTYTDDEHRIVEVLWQRPPAKELTDEEIMDITKAYFNIHPDAHLSEQFRIKLYELNDFAKAILRKAQEK